MGKNKTPKRIQFIRSSFYEGKLNRIWINKQKIQKLPNRSQNLNWKKENAMSSHVSDCPVERMEAKTSISFGFSS